MPRYGDEPYMRRYCFCVCASRTRLQCRAQLVLVSTKEEHHTFDQYRSRFKIAVSIRHKFGTPPIATTAREDQMCLIKESIKRMQVPVDI